MRARQKRRVRRHPTGRWAAAPPGCPLSGRLPQPFFEEAAQFLTASEKSLGPSRAESGERSPTAQNIVFPKLLYWAPEYTETARLCCLSVCRAFKSARLCRSVDSVAPISISHLSALSASALRKLFLCVQLPLILFNWELSLSSAVKRLSPSGNVSSLTASRVAMLLPLDVGFYFYILSHKKLCLF